MLEFSSVLPTPSPYCHTVSVPRYFMLCSVMVPVWVTLLRRSLACILSLIEFHYTVSQKNVPPLASYNFDAHEWILIFCDRNVTDKVGNRKTLYYATSNNLCFCTTWQNAETRKSHISLNWIVLHTQCTYL